MSVLRIDFETRSALDLQDCGVYVYAQHPSTDIWCMAWAFDEDEPEIWFSGMPVPQRVIDHVKAGGEIHAWNANFERLIWRYILSVRYGFPVTKDEQFVCSMALALSYGLPGSLEKAAEVLGKFEKDREGHNLMLRMCRPRRYENEVPVWWDDAGMIRRLQEYCKQDVRAERSAVKDLAPLLESERAIYLFDQRVNDRGVNLDIPLATAAGECARVAIEQANEALFDITRGAVTKVTQATRIRDWVNAQGIECNSVNKDAMAEFAAMDLPEEVEKVLGYRESAGKTSLAKIPMLLEYAKVDGRVRGTLQYHGAGTGRWAGRGPQLHNLPKPTVEDVELLLELIARRDLEALRLFAPPMDVLVTAIRPLLVAPRGKKLVVADYAAIEARVLPWLAGQNNLVEAFRTGTDAYKALASKIYHKPVPQVTKAERDVAKQAVLGLGFQMGHRKFVVACWQKGRIRITEDFSKEVVTVYRTDNDKIVDFWANLHYHAMAAVRREPPPARFRERWFPSESERRMHDWGELPVQFHRDENWLYCTLPSGRTLKYAKPKIVAKEMPWLGKDGNPAVQDTIQIMGVNSVTKKWERQYPYGGFWAENVTQATARDLLAGAMMRVEDAGYDVVLTVHDEVVSEVPEDFGSAKEFERLMCVLPPWAAGCPVAAEAWEGPRYRK
jgi:DNA polymerase